MAKRQKTDETSTIIYVKRLHPDASLPQRQTDGSVGYDLHCIQDFTIVANTKPVTISTGISLESRDGDCWFQILSRSSMAANGIHVCGGVIDADYRGEIKVLLHYIHHGDDNQISFKKGTRIAQLVVHKMHCPTMTEVHRELDSTERGTGGFGSTNK